MLDLSPTKLIIIFVVVIVLLGPKRLPQVARQLGAGWRKIVGFQQQIEQELRETVPDLPSSQDLVRFARSPVTMLNQLAEIPSSPADDPVVDPGAPAVADRSPSAGTATGAAAAAADKATAGAADQPATAGAGSPPDGDRWPEDRSSGAPVPAPAPPPTAGRPGSGPRPLGNLGALAADDPSMN